MEAGKGIYCFLSLSRQTLAEARPWERGIGWPISMHPELVCSLDSDWTQLVGASKGHGVGMGEGWGGGRLKEKKAGTDSILKF